MNNRVAANNSRVHQIVSVIEAETQNDDLKDIFDACASQVSGCISQNCEGDLIEADLMIDKFAQVLKETVRYTLELWKQEGKA